MKNAPIEEHEVTDLIKQLLIKAQRARRFGMLHVSITETEIAGSCVRVDAVGRASTNDLKTVHQAILSGSERGDWALCRTLSGTPLAIVVESAPYTWDRSHVDAGTWFDPYDYL